jgi:opacity protein-like surface antigen
VDVSDTFGFEVNLGWQFTKVFGVELAYVNFGEYTVEETYDGIVDGGREIYKGEENGELEAAGLLMRATLPLADKFDVFGRLGLVYWEISSEGEEIALDENGDEVFSGTWSSLGDLDGISPLIGFGIDYQIMDNWSVYGEFLYLMAEKEDWEQTAYGVFLGAEYRFSGGLSGSNRGSSSRKNTACDPKYKDIGGIMCE